MNDTTAALMPTWEGRCFRLKYVFSVCLMVLYMYRVIRSPTVLSTTRFNGIPRRAQNMQKSRPPNVTGTICPKPRWRRNNIRNGSSMENSFRVQKAYNLVPKVLEPFGRRWNPFWWRNTTKISSGRWLSLIGHSNRALNSRGKFITSTQRTHYTGVFRTKPTGILLGVDLRKTNALTKAGIVKQIAWWSSTNTYK